MGLALLTFLVLTPLLPSPARAASPYTVGPAPSWVAPLAPAPAGAPPPQEGSDGLQLLLADMQTRVTDGGPEHFLHFTRRIASEAGVENGAELRFDVNPAFERLTLHWVRVHRDGTVRDALAGADVQVVQREEGLEARLFDGTRSVLVFLRDVRVGDVVDYAYSTRGQNPVFEGRFADSVSLAYDVPVEHLRYRLLWPRDRPLHVRTHGEPVEPTRREAGGAQEWVWERRQVAAVRTEDSLPPDVDPSTWVQLSEWGSWQEVARWAARQFQRPPRPAPVVAERVRALAAAHATPEARFLAALRFVQDEVRYLGFELGANSHRPHSPGWVLARRFGDCKDKSLLLTALLEGLGVPAEPALVNTGVQAGLDRWLPTPLAFDHVIVRAEVEGREVWVDPTRTLERGGLAQREPPAFGRALRITPASTALVPLPEPVFTEPHVDVEEHYVASGEGGPVTLEVVTRYRGGEADRMRRFTSTTPLADVTRNALNFYARRDTRVRAEGGATVEDDPERNVLTLTERYVIEDFWDAEGQRELWAWLIEEQLDAPQFPQRTQPLAVAHPVNVRHAVRLTLPHPANVTPERREVKSAAFHFDADVRQEGRQLRLDYRYRSRTARLAPEQVASHLGDQRKVRDLLGYTVPFPAPASAGAQGLPVPGWRGLALLGLVSLASMGALLGLTLWGTRRSGGTARQEAPVQALLLRPPPPRPVPSVPTGDALRAPRPPVPGSAPAYALAVEDAAALAAHLAREVCGCGAGLGAPDRHAPGELLRMGEQVITPVALRCGACGEERWRYFRLGLPEA